MTSPTERLSLRDMVKYAFTPSSFDILYEFDPGVPIEEVPRWQLIVFAVSFAVCIAISVVCVIAGLVEFAALLTSP